MNDVISCACSEDLAALLAIDLASNPHPWRESAFQAALNSQSDEIYLYKQQGKIVGFIVWQSIIDEMELHLIAIDPAFRRQKIATKLLQYLFQAAYLRSVKRVLLEVRASNDAAIQLYEQQGFTVFSVRKNYYEGKEDALLMEKLC